MARDVGDVTADRELARWVQRHERKLIVGWLASFVVMVALLAVWGIALNGAERAVDSIDSDWVRELDPIAKRIKSGDHLGAAAELERLDADCPALFVKHRYDRERERLLAMLADCYVALDRRARARETLARLVAFDPRNFDNHFRLAQAERAFGDDVAARAAYEHVLAIHPTHLPSVTAMIEIAFDAGEHQQVIAAYERYLHAWLLAKVRLRLGDVAVELDAPVDGRTRVLETALALPRGWSGPVCVEIDGFSARLVSIALAPQRLVGVAESLEPAKVAPSGDWTATGAAISAQGEIAASAAGSRLCSPVVPLPSGASSARIELALFKTLPPDLWDKIQRSYQNQLELERLAKAAERTRVGGFASAGTVFVD